MTLVCTADKKTDIKYVACGAEIIAFREFSKLGKLVLFCDASQPHKNGYPFSTLDNHEKVFIHGILENSKTQYFACNSLQKNKDKCSSDEQKIKCLPTTLQLGFKIPQ